MYFGTYVCTPIGAWMWSFPLSLGNDDIVIILLCMNNFSKVYREDTGDYVLFASNAVGKKELTISVDVTYPARYVDDAVVNSCSTYNSQ